MRTADKFETVRIEWPNGITDTAGFVDEVFPDRTCGQYDHGIIVRLEGQSYKELEIDCYVSFMDGSVWMEEIRDGEVFSERVLDARCPEVCIMAAVRDAKETFMYDLDESGKLVIV